MKLSLPQYFRGLLKNVVRDVDVPAILFSGGLDTALLAFLVSRRKGIAAITVAVDGQSRDELFAARAAKEFGLTHVWVRPSCEDLLGILPQTIKLLGNFDPSAIRNTVATHVGLLMVKEMNLHAAMTGDGADELFAGHSFFFSKPLKEVPKTLRRLWKDMKFNTIHVGRKLGIDVQTPYLHPLIREFAERIPPEELMAEREGQIHGKAILRRAFEGEIPEYLLWREKCAVEFGAGSMRLTSFLEERVSDDQYRKESDSFLNIDGVRLRSKEHLYYYKLYRSQFGPPPRLPKDGLFRKQPICPDCGIAWTGRDQYCCDLCGASSAS